MSDTPNVLKVIQMWRRERDWTLEQSCEEALKIFDKRGWPMPDSVRQVLMAKSGHPNAQKGKANER